MTWQLVLRDGFQGGWYDWSGKGELTCPNGWDPAWTPSMDEGINHRPEYDKDADHARSGDACAKMFTTHASHEGCLFRRIAVMPGDMVRITAHAAMWKHLCGHGVRVGVDYKSNADFHVDAGAGGVNFNNPDIQWSSWYSQYDSNWAAEEYKALSVAVLPELDYITVFLYSYTQYMAPTAASFWDDVLVEQDTVGTVEPPEGREVVGLLTEILAEVADIRGMMVVRTGG
jgi:hypothetical protein